MPEEKPKPKKAMDIQAPGKSAPSSSARPIIVNHGPMIEDPMVQKSSEPTTAPIPAGHKVIKPLEQSATLGSMVEKVKKQKDASEEKTEESPKTESESNEAEATDSEKQPKEEATSTDKQTEETENNKPADKEEDKEAKSEDSEAQPTTNDESSSSTEGGVVDAVADQTKDRKKEEEQAKQEVERKEKVEKLIAEKKYFVPLSVARHKKTAHNFSVTVVLIGLLVAGVVGAWKLGYIEIDGLIDKINL